MQALRGRFGVMTLGIFGSVARGEEQAISDIDILVTFDGPATFDRFMGLKLYLEDTLGRSIDLVTPVTLRHETRPAVLRDLIDVA
jgi:predicted nucleotidyltransferase